MRVAAELVMCALGAGHAKDLYRVAVAEGLPEGCRAVAVFYEPASDSFLFRLEHESFPLVREGAHVPPADAFVRVVEVPR